MNVEVVFVLDVVAAKLSEAKTLSAYCIIKMESWVPLLGFVPSDDVAQTNLPQAGEEGKGREDDRGEDRLPVVEVVDKSGLLKLAVRCQSPRQIQLPVRTWAAAFFRSSG